MTELLFSTNGLLYVRHSFVNPRSKMLEFTMKSWDPDPWSNFISFGTQLIQLKIVQFHIHEKKCCVDFSKVAHISWRCITNKDILAWKQTYYLRYSIETLKKNLLFSLIPRLYSSSFRKLRFVVFYEELYHYS